jgi:hypothetical protein
MFFKIDGHKTCKALMVVTKNSSQALATSSSKSIGLLYWTEILSDFDKCGPLDYMLRNAVLRNLV